MYELIEHMNVVWMSRFWARRRVSLNLWIVCQLHKAYIKLFTFTACQLHAVKVKKKKKLTHWKTDTDLFAISVFKSLRRSHLPLSHLYGLHHLLGVQLQFQLWSIHALFVWITAAAVFGMDESHSVTRAKSCNIKAFLWAYTAQIIHIITLVSLDTD